MAGDDLAPESRRKRGVPGGEATRFKPGQSGNPGGRPKKKPITKALEKIYSDPEECMAAARALARKARKGSIAHFQEAANRDGSADIYRVHLDGSGLGPYLRARQSSINSLRWAARDRFLKLNHPSLNRFSV